MFYVRVVTNILKNSQSSLLVIINIEIILTFESLSLRRIGRRRQRVHPHSRARGKNILSESRRNLEYRLEGFEGAKTC